MGEIDPHRSAGEVWAARRDFGVVTTAVRGPQEPCAIAPANGRESAAKFFRRSAAAENENKKTKKKNRIL